MTMKYRLNQKIPTGYPIHINALDENGNRAQIYLAHRLDKSCLDVEYFGDLYPESQDAANEIKSLIAKYPILKTALLSTIYDDIAYRRIHTFTRHY